MQLPLQRTLHKTPVEQTRKPIVNRLPFQLRPQVQARNRQRRQLHQLLHQCRPLLRQSQHLRRAALHKYKTLRLSMRSQRQTQVVLRHVPCKVHAVQL